METAVPLGPESELLLVRITGMLKEALSMEKKNTKIQTKSILTIFFKTLIVAVVILCTSVY